MLKFILEMEKLYIQDMLKINKKLTKKIRDFLYPKDYIRLDQLVADIFDPVLNADEPAVETAPEPAKG